MEGGVADPKLDAPPQHHASPPGVTAHARLEDVLMDVATTPLPTGATEASISGLIPEYGENLPSCPCELFPAHNTSWVIASIAHE
jgi:hypothetical protein